MQVLKSIDGNITYTSSNDSNSQSVNTLQLLNNHSRARFFNTSYMIDETSPWYFVSRLHKDFRYDISIWVFVSGYYGCLVVQTLKFTFLHPRPIVNASKLCTSLASLDSTPPIILQFPFITTLCTNLRPPLPIR